MKAVKSSSRNIRYLNCMPKAKQMKSDTKSASSSTTADSSNDVVLLARSAVETRARLDLAIETLRRQDAKLALVIDRVGACQLNFRTLHNPFNTLARSIIYQQLNGKAAGAIHARVVERVAANKRTLAPQEIFDASEESLRECGLSGAKTLALRDLAARSLDGTVPTLARLKRMSDEDIINHLTIVRGVGRWTVEMMLMFRLGRPDVLPVGDFAICKAAMLLDDLPKFPTAKELIARGEAWRPYRTVACWYLWRSLDQPAESVAKK